MKINLKNYLLYLDRTGLGKGICYMDDGFDESEVFLLINELIEPHLTELVFWKDHFVHGVLGQSKE